MRKSEMIVNRPNAERARARVRHSCVRDDDVDATVRVARVTYACMYRRDVSNLPTLAVGSVGAVWW